MCEAILKRDRRYGKLSKRARRVARDKTLQEWRSVRADVWGAQAKVAGRSYWCVECDWLVLV